MADALRTCVAERHKAGNPLPVTEFSTDPSKPSGLSSWCRACMNAAARDRTAADPAPGRARHARQRATLAALRPRWQTRS
jgi:hypothetical protein